MTTAKITTLTFRIEPAPKKCAAHGRRPRTPLPRQYGEVLIRDYSVHNGIAIPEQGELFAERQKPRSGTK